MSEIFNILTETRDFDGGIDVKSLVLPQPRAVVFPIIERTLNQSPQGLEFATRMVSDPNNAQRIWAEWSGYAIITQQLEGGEILKQIRNAPFQSDRALYNVFSHDIQGIIKDPFYQDLWQKDKNEDDFDIDSLAMKQWARFIGAESYGDFSFKSNRTPLDMDNRRFISGNRLIAITDPWTSELINRSLWKGFGSKDTQNRDLLPKAAPDGYILETYPVTVHSEWGDPETFRRVRLIGAIEYTAGKMFVGSKITKLLGFADQLENGEDIWVYKIVELFEDVVKNIFNIEDGLKVIGRVHPWFHTVFLKLGFESGIRDIDRRGRHPWENVSWNIPNKQFTPFVSIYSAPKAPAYRND